MKKTAFLSLLLLMVVTLIGCGEKVNPTSDFEYIVMDDDTIEITKYIGNNTNVTISRKIDGKNVSGIGMSAFCGLNIKKAVIPNTVEYIGTMAFENCKELNEVTFHSNSKLRYIGDYAFKGCIGLQKIDISKTQVQWIDEQAFYGCTGLKEINFSDTLEEIREKAFYECSSLLTIKFPENLTKIGGGTFGYCSSLKSVVIPPNLDLTFTGEACFHNVSSLEQIVFEEGREEIAGYALFQIAKINTGVEIVVPKGVKRFSPESFLVHPDVPINVVFEGDAPEIQGDLTWWFGNPTIYYDSTTNGWDKFIEDENYTVKAIQN